MLCGEDLEKASVLGNRDACQCSAHLKACEALLLSTITCSGSSQRSVRGKYVDGGVLIYTPTKYTCRQPMKSIQVI